MVGWIILIIVLVIGLYILAKYNSFIVLRNRIQNAWAQINVELKRRYDLIPNLVSTVKGYAAHESQTLERVIAARNQAINNGANASVSDVAASQAAISTGLRSIFALSENYPDLKANTNFLELQRELSDTENKIQAARRFYNGTVKDFNTKVESVPSNIVAKMFSFKQAEFFDLADNDAAQQAVEVKF